MTRLEQRFIRTMRKLARATGIPEANIRRNEYVRLCVDMDIQGRLNKQELNDAGGFQQLRDRFFEPPKILVDRPKILIFDIETAPILAHVWGLWDNDVALNQIQSDWHVMSWAAKWLDDSPKKVMYEDQRHCKDMQDDSGILESIWHLLDEADAVITQNGIRFDRKKLNARFALNGFPPPSSYKHIDTLQIAKKHFAFTSNRLAYLTDNLCVKYKKLDHGKFAGFKMWSECMKGNMKAWKEMEKYNRYDVLSLEEVYKQLMPWDNTLNFNLYHDKDMYICSCGSKDFRNSGYFYNTTGKFQRYTCNRCGAETRDSKNLFSKEKKKALRRKTTRR